MLEWLINMPWKLRLILSGIFLMISTVLALAGYIWPWGWGVGVVLLMFGGPSLSEKKGYRDY